MPLRHSAARADDEDGLSSFEVPVVMGKKDRENENTGGAKDAKNDDQAVGEAQVYSILFC